jgi:hypothetical protein
MTNFADRFKAYEAELKASLLRTRSSFQHAGIKGSEVETSFRTFLSNHLPRKLTVGTGEILDREARRSPQMDVVISNDDQPFRSEQDTPGLMLIEGVAASCEVKTRLNKASLHDCIQKGYKLKELHNQYSTGDEICSNLTDRIRFYNQPPYFVVCFENEIATETIGATLARTPPSDICEGIAIPAIDALFILGQGAWINYGDGTGSLTIKWGETAVESTGSEFAQGWTWIPSDHVLVDLLLWLHASMPAVRRFQSIATEYYLNTVTSRLMQPFGWIGLAYGHADEKGPS